MYLEHGARKMTRNRFLKTAAATALGMAAQRFSAAQPIAPPRTYSDKTGGGCESKANVHGAGARTRKPVFIWVHGGALINGSRKSVSGPFFAGLLKEGDVVIPDEYRLAPET